MIEALRGWLTSVMITAFLLSTAERLVPEGTLRKIASATCSLILLLVLLRPATELGGGLRRMSGDSYRVTIEQQRQRLQDADAAELAAEVAKRTEQYIQERAQAIGIRCRPTVGTRTEQHGLPIPWEITFDCAESSKLAEIVERELGIPRERQVYSGTNG